MPIVLPTGDDFIAAVAERFTTIAEDCVQRRGSAQIALTGGRTAARVYAALADGSREWRGRFPWRQTHFFWGDERLVPPGHADSNYGMAARFMLDAVDTPVDQVHRVRGEDPPQEAARAYQRELPARFDLALLSIGADAHIASIFPGSVLVHEPRQGAAAVWVPHLAAWRVSLTPQAILSADRILVLAAGQDKANAVQRAFKAKTDEAGVPAHLLRRAGDRVEWFADTAAASQLVD